MRRVEAESTGPGERDVQTVTPEGAPTRVPIDGVVTHTPITQVDHRGALFEIHNLDPALGSEPVVWAYADTVRPGQTKGWARHEVKIDRYTLIVGHLLVLLHDDRAGSPTHGQTQARRCCRPAMCGRSGSPSASGTCSPANRDRPPTRAPSSGRDN